jgi:hypothetical protein
MSDRARQAPSAFDELLAPIPSELRQRFERDVHAVLESLMAPSADAG